MHPQTASTIGIGTVYLLHFSRPLGNPEKPHGTAQHYCGFTADDSDGSELDRVAQHLAGQGAKITRAAVAQGIAISLVVTWRAPRSFEREVKQRKNLPRLCPICCAARGRKVTRIVPVEQLALPLFDQADWDGDDFPDPPHVAMSWSEIKALQGWRQASAVPALAGVGDICEDIPY